MRRQLAFDFMLMKEKKWNLLTVLLGDLLYLALGCIIFYQNSFLMIIATILLATLHSYNVFILLSVHTNRNNQGSSNYVSCIYFPTKRSYFFLSRIFYTIVTMVHVCFIILLMVILMNACSPDLLERSLLIGSFSYAVVTILWFSAIMMITSFSGRSANTGRVLAFMLLGMVAGGVTAFLQRTGDASEIEIAIRQCVIMIGALFAFWSLMTFLAYQISKKITV